MANIFKGMSGGYNVDVLMFTNFGAYDGNAKKLTLSKNFKYVIVTIDKGSMNNANGQGTYTFIHSIVPSRTSTYDDTKQVDSYGRAVSSRTVIYKDCKTGDVITAGAKSGTPCSVKIIGIS